MKCVNVKTIEHKHLCDTMIACLIYDFYSISRSVLNEKFKVSLFSFQLLT